MQFRSTLLMAILGLCGASCLNLAVAGGTPRLTFPITVDDEDSVPFSALSYVGGVAKLNLTAPLLCANIGSPVATAVQVKPYFGTFVFGSYVASDSTDQGQSVRGVASMSYGANGQQSLRLLSDPSLVCYGLNALGVRKPTRDLFIDAFDEPTFDSSISVVVYDLPNFGNSYTYSYYVYVSIPVVDGPLQFIVRDGYDAAVFNRSGTQIWCLAQASSPSSCSGTTGDFGSGNINYTINLTAGQSFNRRFIVHRSTIGTAGLPSTANPLVMAALFSPPVQEEVKLDNNVAVGLNTYGNLPPIFPTVPDLSGITEGVASGTRSFTIQDDTEEGAGHLTATVDVNLNGTITPVTPSCVNSGGYTGTGVPVIKTCSFSITKSANFATNSLTSASVSITAVDALGISASNVQTLTVASADNDAPTVTVSSIADPDAANDNMPTLTCSLGSFTGASCLGSLTNFLTAVAPAPADAVDELAAQTAAFVVDTSTGRGGNIACTLDAGSMQIFTPAGAPQLSPSGPAANYTLNYVLNGVNSGSATCTINIVDAQAGGFPAGQIAQRTTTQFRIVVTPS